MQAREQAHRRLPALEAHVAQLKSRAQHLHEPSTSETARDGRSFAVANERQVVIRLHTQRCSFERVDAWWARKRVSLCRRPSHRRGAAPCGGACNEWAGGLFQFRCTTYPQQMGRGGCLGASSCEGGATGEQRTRQQEEAEVLARLRIRKLLPQALDVHHSVSEAGRKRWQGRPWRWRWLRW